MRIYITKDWKEVIGEQDSDVAPLVGDEILILCGPAKGTWRIDGRRWQLSSPRYMAVRVTQTEFPHSNDE
jgi:hypothetical protein